MLSAAAGHLTLDHFSPKLQLCLFVFHFCLWSECKAVVSGSHPQGTDAIPTVAAILPFPALGPINAVTFSLPFNKPIIALNPECSPPHPGPLLIDKTNLSSTPTSAAAHILLQIMYRAADN